MLDRVDGARPIPDDPIRFTAANCIHGKTMHFSVPGDSESIAIDEDGRVVGLLIISELLVKVERERRYHRINN